MCLTLQVSLDCPVLIAPSGFLNFNYNNHHLHFMCLIQSYYYFRMFRYIISCLLLVIVPVIFSTELVVDKLSSDPIDSRFLYKLLSKEPDLIRKHLLADSLRALSRHESEDDMNELPKRSHMWFGHIANAIPIQTRLSFGQPLSRNGIGSIHKIRYGKK